MSGFELPNELFDKVISGDLTLEQLKDLQSAADLIVDGDAKTASTNIYSTVGSTAGAAGKAVKPVTDAVGKALKTVPGQIALLGGASAGAGALLDVLKTVATATKETAEYKSALRRIYNTHPDVGEYPANEVRLAFRSLWTINPRVAMDPLMGGQYLKSILNARTVGGVGRSKPMVEDRLLQSLRMVPGRSSGPASATQALTQQGVGAALKGLQGIDLSGG